MPKLFCALRLLTAITGCIKEAVVVISAAKSIKVANDEQISTCPVITINVC
ncbi:hypothetical protein I5907_20905 [Panacibacter sp. DH6]|uniref:Uncharacterized protein n=1 Tax=Panacibacter microcysteis TaxID=2793269 RepID=A0A931H0D4_9BACT|nr:hypothetical protein [Panacibacter microcysteis]MBG9378704.1 hypothetical protein [Panacibacter microcysteis]